MKTPFLSLLLAGVLVMAATSSRAEEQAVPPSWEDSQKMLEEGAQRMISTLELLLLAIPQYALPEVLPNGDILIRRKHPEKEPDAPPQSQDRDRT